MSCGLQIRQVVGLCHFPAVTTLFKGHLRHAAARDAVPEGYLTDEIQEAEVQVNNDVERRTNAFEGPFAYKKFSTSACSRCNA